ncbi:cuticular protein 128, RR-1 family [Anopheles darlingi]|uniref:Cuticular protein 128, RR-1 family n=1 Tax=Anopheles darlingi TaxID=43151 RepID=W5JNU5_ANODA|nr:cuticular protein 128, RR-1 family [Anopheles darlingi]
MSAKGILLLLLVTMGSLSALVRYVRAAPQAEKYEAVSDTPGEFRSGDQHSSILYLFQYEYKYEVKDPEKQLFFDKNEAGDTAGKVTGRYSVWLPDGRLMTIKYIVDKEGGFQPEVDFQDNANPLSG